MKKLLIILLLLISTYSFGQAVLSGSRGWDGQYNIRANEFFARCVTAGVTLTTEQKRWYNDSIFVPLSDSGLIGTTRGGDSIQAIWVLATFPNGSETVCKLNLLSDSNSITNVNSVTFTDSGAVGNGTSSYLNTNFNNAYDSSICKAFSVSIGAYNQDSSVNMGYSGIGLLTNTSRIALSHKVSYTNASVNLNCVNEAMPSSSNSLGFMMGSYYSPNKYRFIIRNSLIVSASGFSDPSYTVTAGNIYAMGWNFSGNIYQPRACNYTFIVIGSGLSFEKARALSNILNNSLKGRGYNVY